MYRKRVGRITILEIGLVPRDDDIDGRGLVRGQGHIAQGTVGQYYGHGFW